MRRRISLNRQNSKALHGLLCIAGVTILTGCGGSTEVPPEPPSAVPPTAETTADWKPARSVEYGAVYATGRSTDKTTLDGASFKVKIGLGALTPASLEAVPPEFHSLLEKCNVDATVDAAVPMRTTLENDSSVTFTPRLIMGLTANPVEWPVNPNPILEVEAASSLPESQTCQFVSQAGESQLTLRSTVPQESGDEIETDWIWIIREYFSPEFVDGQPAKLSGIGVYVEPSIEGAGTGRQSRLEVTQTCFDGEREFAELWEGAASANPDGAFLPRFTLGDPADEASLLTMTELRNGTPSETPYFDADQFDNCSS